MTVTESQLFLTNRSILFFKERVESYKISCDQNLFIRISENRNPYRQSSKKIFENFPFCKLCPFVWTDQSQSQSSVRVLYIEALERK